LSSGTPPRVAHGLAEDTDAGSDPRHRGTDKAERDAHSERDDHAGRSGRAARTDEPDGDQRSAGPERAREESQRRAFYPREKEETPPGGSACPQEGEVPS